jgi:hypothetical protein
VEIGVVATVEEAPAQIPTWLRICKIDFISLLQSLERQLPGGYRPALHRDLTVGSYFSKISWQAAVSQPAVSIISDE